MDVPAPDPQDLIHLLINIAMHQLTITQDVRAVLATRVAPGLFNQDPDRH